MFAVVDRNTVPNLDITGWPSGFLYGLGLGFLAGFLGGFLASSPCRFSTWSQCFVFFP